jgi:chaperonin GroES
MSFNAVEDKVIVKIAKVEEATESGLFIPDTATSMPDQGTVVSAGPGRYTSTGVFMPNTVSVGDRVMFSARAAQRIELEGEDYLIFLNEHILAIVTD